MYILFQLLLLLEASFVDEAKYLSISPLYSLVADLLVFLHKHESDTLRESSGIFWKLLSDSVQRHVEQADQDNSYTLARYDEYLILIRVVIQWQIRGRTRHSPPYGPNSFPLTYKLYKTQARRELAPPNEVGAPLREILDPPL